MTMKIMLKILVCLVPLYLLAGCVPGGFAAVDDIDRINALYTPPASLPAESLANLPATICVDYEISKPLSTIAPSPIPAGYAIVDPIECASGEFSTMLLNKNDDPVVPGRPNLYQQIVPTVFAIYNKGQTLEMMKCAQQGLNLYDQNAYKNSACLAFNQNNYNLVQSLGMTARAGVQAAATRKVISDICGDDQDCVQQATQTYLDIQQQIDAATIH